MQFSASTPRYHPTRQATAIRRSGGSVLLIAGILAIAALVRAEPVAAQTTVDAAAAVPGFWDPRRRPERPDLGRISIIRFLTEIDYRPFNYPGTDGNPSGFNVDLARPVSE